MRELLDTRHLDEQTFGDEQLRAEVLELFQTQTPVLLDALDAAEGRARAEIAHRLKGSCLAIGANRLADAAGVIEDAPQSLLDVRSVSDATLLEIAKILEP